MKKSTFTQVWPKLSKALLPAAFICLAAFIAYAAVYSWNSPRTPPSPPRLDVSLARQRIEASQLSCTWTWESDRTGQPGGFIADAPHALDFRSYDDVTLFLNGADGEINEIELRFRDDYPPDRVGARRWPAEDASGITRTPEEWRALVDGAEPVEINGGVISVLNDGRAYVYEVSAGWPEGHSDYVFSTNGARRGVK